MGLCASSPGADDWVIEDPNPPTGNPKIIAKPPQGSGGANFLLPDLQVSQGQKNPFAQEKAAAAAAQAAQPQQQAAAPQYSLPSQPAPAQPSQDYDQSPYGDGGYGDGGYGGRYSMLLKNV